MKSIRLSFATTSVNEVLDISGSPFLTPVKPSVTLELAYTVPVYVPFKR